MLRLIFATKNRGKLKEVRSIFSDTEFEITSLLDLNYKFNVEETKETFEGNARKKAEEIFTEYKNPVIADDSGIEVEQLNGMPGVYSARYAGKNATDNENNQKLLDELKNFPEPHPARYICYAVYYNGKHYLMEYGEIKGNIIMMAKGTNGFGYDPLFVPIGYNQTMAELSPGIKNSISHRGQAFIKLKEKIKSV